MILRQQEFTQSNISQHMDLLFEKNWSPKMSYSRYSQRPPLFRPYFAVLLLSACAFCIEKYYWLFIVAVFFVSSILFLSTYWSFRSELLQCFKKDKTGKYILYSGCILRLNPEKPTKSFPAPCYSFWLKNRKHLFLQDKIVPVIPKLTFTFNEIVSGAEQKLQKHFPPNDLHVPKPSFLQLFKEQCVTPLFCFQVFSSLLMCFDEHVLQGLFSTFMIILVEAALVGSRFATLRIFRTLENREIPVKRVKQEEFNKMLDSKGTPKCTEVSSRELIPGDIVCIKEPIRIPCDAVVLLGSCAVNEAMLSGESTPIIKEGVSPDDTVLELNRHKRHILYGHTQIEKVTEPVYCRVIRTGFETEQGILLNKMIMADDIKYDPEALKFVFILTGLALINSLFTFLYSKKTGYPLFIDIIVLFTSSIPFELPMEMSMVVHNVVKNLIKKRIFCLEPFRLILAGKVNVCCFDKTGTLTNTEIELRALRHEGSRSSKLLSCCNSLMEVNGVLRGDSLDIAIYDYLKKNGIVEDADIIKQFQFTSELKRHCTLARFNQTETIFAMKGAPETVKTFLKEVPSFFDNYMKYASEGYRVLALASKLVEQQGNMTVHKQQEYENELDFEGFILFGSTLKKQAVETCGVLKESGHKVVMITGDNLLTAKCVADELGIDGTGVEGVEIDRVLDLMGPSSKRFYEVGIFARADPQHKERIIKRYNQDGWHTMMVGDGTNDVGALKAASVGVAMLEGPISTPASPEHPGVSITQSLVSVKPGDASVAAPFTVRSGSLDSISEIIQHGRSSLVTTIQMYKILALNCISNAFLLVFIDIFGIKFSETQMVFVGVLLALAFAAISASKPLSFISKQRPITTIFSPYMMVSIIGQALTHIFVNGLLFWYVPNPPVSTTFEPSVMNTLLLVVSCAQTISTFACNYIGRPFREDFQENKIMVLSILGLSCLILNILFKVHDEINSIIQVVNVDEYVPFILGALAFDCVVSYLVEKVSFKLFLVNN